MSAAFILALLLAGPAADRRIAVTFDDLPAPVAAVQSNEPGALRDELGNHTYSHPSLNTTPLDEFQQDVLGGEVVTRRLVEGRGQRLRYFRHPFLRTGGTELPKKRAFEAFLSARGYEVAPVTVDNGEYIYAAVYADAFPDLASGMKSRGYRFVTLEEALRDEAYRRRDDGVGARGWSWLHRWRMDAGQPLTPGPEPPAWVADAYRTRARP